MTDRQNEKYQLAEQLAEFFEDYDVYGFRDAFGSMEDAVEAFSDQLSSEDGMLSAISDLLECARNLMD